MHRPSRRNLVNETKSTQPYKHRRTFFIAALALQVVLLAALAVPRLVTMSTGKTVTFETTPVDPWDMFRGDYVTLGYGFSDVPTVEEFKYETPIFVTLRRDASGKWKAVDGSKTYHPPASDEEVVLRGKTQYSSGKSVRVRYSIEQVFVAEGAGKNVKSGDHVYVDTVIDDNGNAVIKEVRADQNVLYRFKLI